MFAELGSQINMNFQCVNRERSHTFQKVQNFWKIIVSKFVEPSQQFRV